MSVCYIPLDKIKAYYSHYEGYELHCEAKMVASSMDSLKENILEKLEHHFTLLRTAIFNTLRHVCQYQSIQLILLSSRYPAQNYK